MRTIIKIEKIITKKVRTKLGSTKIIFIDRGALILREPFIYSFYISLYNRQYKQKNDRCHERKTEPLRGRVHKNQKPTNMVLEY